MEPVAFTYSTRSLYGNSAGRSGTAKPENPAAEQAGSAVSSDRAVNRTEPTAPANSGEQRGIQASGISAEEFRPYSPPQSSGLADRAAVDRGSGVNSAYGKVGDGAAVPTARQTGSAATDESKKSQDPQVQAAIASLKSIEAKVKAHEAAHKSAGGTMTGPVSYSYTRGPDGKNYITGGEVPINISTGRTPQETISRMQQVIQAALAPADPSPQDRAVAAQAAAQQQQARLQQAEVSAPSGASDTASGQSYGSGTTQETTPDTQKPGSDNSAARPDNVTANASRRAYSNPAVNGGAEDARDGIVPRPVPQTASTSSENTGTSPFSLIPSSITGFGTSRPLSYYA